MGAAAGLDGPYPIGGERLISQQEFLVLFRKYVVRDHRDVVRGSKAPAEGQGESRLS